MNDPLAALLLITGGALVFAAVFILLLSMCKIAADSDRQMERYRKERRGDSSLG